MSSNHFFAAAFSLAFVAGGPRAQSESETLGEASALPIASVASVGGEPDASASLIAATSGFEFVVRTVESSAYRTCYAMERLRDGSILHVEIGGRSHDRCKLAVGSVVTGAAVSTGVVFSTEGRSIAFVPNALGRILLDNQATARA